MKGYMTMEISVLIPRLTLICVGLYLIVYRVFIRYNAENITLKVVETQKAWQSPVSWGFYRYFVTYEYDGCMYQQKSIEFGFFWHSFQKKVYYNLAGKRSGTGKISCNGIWDMDKIALALIVVGVGSFFNRRF